MAAGFALSLCRMILRDRPAGLRLFLLLRGSILPRIRSTLLLNTLISVLATVLHGNLFSVKITLTAIPFTLIGLPLAIFLGFRNTAAYDRYWEGRKLWGDMLLRCRNLARQSESLIVPCSPDEAAEVAELRERLLRRAIGFVHASRLLLRDVKDASELERWLPAAEWPKVAAAKHKPEAIMRGLGQELRLCLQRRWLDPNLVAVLDANLSGISAASASCERIKSTPVPFSYTLLLHRTAYLYCFMLPFGLVDVTGFMTPIVVVLVAYTFYGLDALGDEIEEPFGVEPNDLPLDAICRAIEINLLEALDSPELPPSLLPENFQLT
jgi:putative membrane protein